MWEIPVKTIPSSGAVDDLTGTGVQQRMIHESFYWKEPLLDTAKWLRRVGLSDRTRESTYVKIEKELFIGFYSVRRLLEANKLSNLTRTITYTLTWYPNLRPVDALNRYQLEKLYNLKSGGEEQRSLPYLCNQFIHSYIFILAGDTSIDGFFIASEHVRNKKVYYVHLSQVLHAFRSVGRDYPSEAQYVRDSNTEEMQLVHSE